MSEIIKKRLELGSELLNLLADSLTKPRPIKSYTDLHSTGLALQFHSNFGAALSLISQGLESEAWIVGRSMSEILIKLKWVHRRKSNAHWMVLGTELADHQRFSSQKSRSPQRKAAIVAIEKRFLNVLPGLSKKGRFWHKTKRGQVRSLPTIKIMAKEAGMVGIYQGLFKWGSDHSHASHRILQRFMILDNQRNFAGKFVVNPPAKDDLWVSYHIPSMAMIFLGLLRKYRWPVNGNRFRSIGRRLLPFRPSHYRLRQIAPAKQKTISCLKSVRGLTTAAATTTKAPTLWRARKSGTHCRPRIPSSREERYKIVSVWLLSCQRRATSRKSKNSLPRSVSP